MQQRVLLSKRVASGASAADNGILRVEASTHHRQGPLSAKLSSASADGPTAWAFGYVLLSCTIGPVLWAAIAYCPIPSCCRRRAPNRSGTALTRDGEAPATRKRVVYLDLWRVICVCIVVISHAGGDLEAYVDYNMLGGQQWVLPVLLLVSGTCYARSSADPFASASRLLSYFALGSALNWLAALATGVHWWEDVATRGVTFQMFYVAGLATAIIVLAPLKAMLLAKQEGEPERQRFGAYGVTFSAILVGVVVAWCLDRERLEPSQVQLLRVLAESVATVLLPVVGLSFLSAERHDLIGWAMLAFTYATRIANPEPRPGTEFHLFELFAFALVVQKVPMRGQAAVGLALASWWPVLCFACGFLLHPGLRLREDLFPPDTIIERVRHYVVEVVAVVAFTAIPAAGPERTLVVPDVLRNNLTWANAWALFAYCSHYAIFRLVPMQPLGVALVFAAALPFALLGHWLWPSEEPVK